MEVTWYIRDAIAHILEELQYDLFIKLNVLLYSIIHEIVEGYIILSD